MTRYNKPNTPLGVTSVIRKVIQVLLTFYNQYFKNYLSTFF